MKLFNYLKSFTTNPPSFLFQAHFESLSKAIINSTWVMLTGAALYTPNNIDSTSRCAL